MSSDFCRKKVEVKAQMNNIIRKRLPDPGLGATQTSHRNDPGPWAYQSEVDNRRAGSLHKSGLARLLPSRLSISGSLMHSASRKLTRGGPFDPMLAGLKCIFVRTLLMELRACCEQQFSFPGKSNSWENLVGSTWQDDRKGLSLESLVSPDSPARPPIEGGGRIVFPKMIFITPPRLSACSPAGVRGPTMAVTFQTSR